MNIILQVISTLGLIGAIFLGEYISSIVFGTTKMKWYVLEIVLFVAVLVPLINSISLFIENIVIVLLVYSICGFLTVVSARWLISVFGGTERRADNGKKLERSFELYLRNIIRNLKRHGLTETVISEVLVNSGFKREQFERFL